MSEDNNEIVKDFVDESKVLIRELVELLEEIEGDYTQVSKLSDYGNKIDRIMGGAKSIAIMLPPEHAVHMIGDYAALCKAVGYKASHVQNNKQLFDIIVALLLDATETLDGMMGRLNTSQNDLKKSISNTFLERVRWASEQLSDDLSSSVDTGTTTGKMGQDEIDEMLRKLGL